MLQFTPITLADREQVCNFLREKDYPGDQYSFGNLYIWRKIYHAAICVEDGFLFVRSGEPGRYVFMCPVGSGDLRQAVEKLREWCRGNGCALRMEWVPAEDKEALEALFPGKLRISTDRDRVISCLRFRTHSSTLIMHRRSRQMGRYTGGWRDTFSRIPTNFIKMTRR